MVDSVLASHLRVAGSSLPAPSRKQLSLRARRTSGTSQVLDEFATSSPGVDPSTGLNFDSSTSRHRTSSGMTDRSRSSTGLSAKDSSERPRVARLHSQLTAAALRDRNMGTSNAVVFSGSTMFSTREYESTDDDDSEDGDLRNAVMF